MISGPPPAPERSFASDNAAGVLPEVMAAVQDANRGSSLAYGDDRWTGRAVEAFRRQFGPATDVAICWGGTGANVVALQWLLRPWQGVVCVEGAHVNVDECGAAERMIGAKLLSVPGATKLEPRHVDAAMAVQGNPHHVQPGAISISQATESGELYSLDELAALVRCAHDHGLGVHVDGARLANAAAALGCSVAEMTTDVGVDVVSVGGTKAGGMFGDAVVVPGGDVRGELPFIRKQFAQLSSKMRFASVQFEALFADDLWIHRAGQANSMAARLADRLADIDGVELNGPPAVNSVFARIPPAALGPLQEWSFFWEWDHERTLVRWMASFETTAEDVERFVAGVEWFVSRHR